MSNEATVITGKLDDSALKESIAELVSTVKLQTEQMATDFDKAIKSMQESLKSLGKTTVNLGMTDSGDSAKRTKSNTEETKSAKEKKETYDQLADSMQKGANSAKVYSEEVVKLATAIREMEDWKKTGSVIVGDYAYHDPSKSLAPLRQRKSLEDQIEWALNRQKEIEEQNAKAIEAERREKEKEAAATQNSVSLEQRKAQLIEEELEKVDKLKAKLWERQEKNLKAFDSTPYNDPNLSKIRQEIEKVWKLQDMLSAAREKLMSGQYVRIVMIEPQQAKEQIKNVDELRNAIASLLSIDEREVKNMNLKTATYNQLTEYMKQLQSAYKNLGGDLATSGSAGKMLADEMIRVNREIQKIQHAQTRPSDLKKVLGLDEKTLDDITYKMQQLSLYRSGVDLTDKNKADEIKRVNAEYDRLQKQQREVLGQNKSLLESNNALARSFNYMKNRLAFYFTVGASTQFVKQIYEIRSQYELLERSIGILIDSAQQGSQIFSELNSMAIKSPFTTMELGAAAKQLVAYDVAAKDVVKTTKRLADMAAAVGIPLERLTYALGQIKSYGYLNARDARMFANAGIPLVRELADRYTELEGRLVSMSDVYDRIKKKAISYEDVMATINKMTDEGGKFFNFQEKAADTMKVRLANLTLAYNNMLNEMGKDNQWLLTQPLILAKELFEKWRLLNTAVNGTVKVLGVGAAASVFWLRIIKQQTWEMTLQTALGQKLGGIVLNIARSMKALALNPMTWIATAVVAAGYLVQRFFDIKAANEQFNKSVQDNAKENINSIDKFFEEYKRQLEGIGGESIANQSKMWERLQEEIEKATKAAAFFVSELEKIQDLPTRINVGKSVLEQIKEINKEVDRLAKLRSFNIGGGVFDDTLAKNLKDFEETLNEYMTTGSVNLQKQRLKTLFKDTSLDFYEAKQDLIDLGKILDNIDLNRVMGDSGSSSMMLANLREATSIIRENILATEEGQKVGIEGRMLMNKYLDEWITKKALEYDLITDTDVKNKQYTQEQIARIERARTAWETFFDQVSNKDKKTLEYIIRYGKYTSTEFQNIWDKATENLKNSSYTAYNYIKSQIEELRNTPEIVIDLVYKASKETLDEQQQQYVRDLLEPVDAESLTVEQYLAEKQKLTEKYGRFQRKQDEDNVEWEKRLGEEYQNNIERITSLNAQLKNRNKLSNADYSQKEKEKNLLEETNKALEEIGKRQNFNFEQFKKGNKGSKKDVLGEAFAKEVEIITNMQKRFKEYRKEGVGAQDAITRATEEYGKTLKSTNDTLAGFGVKTKTGDQIAGMGLRDVRDYFNSMLETANRLGNAKGVEALEKAIASLNVEINKVDYKRLTEGLNNELARLKDDYELNVELSADPEMGDMFTSLFDIDPSQLPQSIDDYAERVLQRLNAFFSASNVDLKLPHLNLTDADIDSFRNMVYDENLPQGAFDLIEKSVNEIRELRQKDAKETLTQVRDLQYELSNQYGKIAIEEKKLADLQKRYAEEGNEAKKQLLDLQIKKQQEVIDGLSAGILQLMPTYNKLFGGIAEHSQAVTRKLAKNLKKAYLDAQKRGKTALSYDGSKLSSRYEFIDPESGERVILTEKQLGTEIDKVNKELLKSQNIFAKLKEDFTDGEDGLKDYAQGLTDLADELEKVVAIINAVGNLADAMGFSQDTVDDINNIAKAAGGIVGIVKGIAELKSGNYLSGIASVISGIADVIGGLLGLNGYNKMITREVEKSEQAVSQLAIAYQRLSYWSEKAMATEETKWRRVAIRNKEAQLEELKRQLVLEQMRKKKDQDIDKQNQLRSEIVSLQQEIQNLTEDVVNNMLGNNVKSAAEEFVDTWVQAWKAGETTLDAVEKKMDSVIENLIKKAMTNKIVGTLLQPFYDEVDRMTKYYSEGGEELTIDELKQLAEKAGILSKDINVALGEFYGNLESLGIISKTQEQSKQLSALQQGIQSITEDTAGALEAYANNISQQGYLRNELLTQIRDALVMTDSDMAMGVQAQMLLQLQQSFQVQMAIQAILLGWSTPSGNAIRIEMV